MNLVLASKHPALASMCGYTGSCWEQQALAASSMPVPGGSNRGDSAGTPTETGLDATTLHHKSTILAPTLSPSLSWSPLSPLWWKSPSRRRLDANFAQAARELLLDKLCGVLR